MKKIFLPALTAFTLAMLLLACSNSSRSAKGVVDIKDVRNSEEPQPNLGIHVAFDVEVYRTRLFDESYMFFYYQLENGNMVCHKAIYGSKDHYQKAAYHWLNDTMITFRLYNPDSKKELRVKLFGKGENSGVIAD